MSADEQHLIDHGVRPTAMRLLILRTMREQGNAMTPRELEQTLETVDLSTVTRTLHSFMEHRVVHRVADSFGRTLYALCSDGCGGDMGECSDHTDTHAHFTCTACGRTFCLHDQEVPRITLPQGFTLDSAAYTVTGLCPDCNPQR